MNGKNPVSVLVAEDDDDYFALVKEIMAELEFGPYVRRFSDGEELMGYLTVMRKSADIDDYLRTVIILDLNMPRKTGHEALREIRASSALRRIPVVVMSVSSDPMDIARCYEEGANSFITKPFDLERLTETFRVFKEYWFNKVSLPAG